MTLEGLELSRYEISQTINLKKAFGVPIEDRSLRQEIGQFFIDTILDRTEKSRQVDGSAMPKYSKEYKDSEEFELYGKSPSERNMTLTGDMLLSLDVLNDSESKIILGFKDDEQRAKAAGHQGGYGPNGSSKAKRAFFGITDKEIQKAKEKFAPDLGRINKGKTLADFLLESEAFDSLFQREVDRRFLSAFDALGLDNEG